MARIKNLQNLIDELEPTIRKAFRDAIKNITSDVQLNLLERAIRQGNTDAALRVLSMDASYFRPLDEALRAAHLAGADMTFNALKASAGRKGIRIGGGFDSRNFRAEELIRKWSSEKVVAIKENTRIAVRETLEAAIARGTSPRATALDLVGRLGPNGTRTGGVIGLDPYRANIARKVQTILSDPERIKEYFIIDRETDSWKPRYKTTDRRFDGAIKRAIKDGKALNATSRQKLHRAHNARLLKLRGEAIARTELLGSLHAAQDEGLQQIIDTGRVNPDAIVRTWDASNDRFTRDTHRQADGQQRRKGEPFLIGGHVMQYPGDQQAPAEEVINCRCFLKVDVDFVSGLKNRLTQEELEEVRALM